MSDNKEMSKAYEPGEHEDKIYAAWLESGFFNPDNLPGDRKESFSIMMPPPNVTGVLHLGHALENALMDAMARYQRLNGKKVLLVPGTDHAALPTQAKVEKMLMEGGMKNPRQELGREKLVEKIREFAEASRTTILGQVKKMGTSCDWSRLAYTFDTPRNIAVNELFRRMYNDGLIYRGYRVVNWSIKGQSTCSDDEIEHLERSSLLYTFKYSKDFPITIATTQPETKLGDTAVAVHPSDERYQKYIGQTFVVDVGAEKPLEIKIIADENVDPNFGTGALGVTPAHSQVDFLMYENQKASGNPIGMIQVIGTDGKMTKEAGVYAGLTTEEARAKFVDWLKQQGLLEKEPEEILQNVGIHSRYKDVIEVLPMTQWWLNVQKIIPSKGKNLRDLMREALTIGLDGDTKQKVVVTPERFTKLYLNRVENLRDWCLSRQTWWGHRIPVWYKHASQPVQITFLRHGESQANLDKVGAGHLDSPLTEKGRNDAKELGNKIDLKLYDIVYSSDLVRASEMAEIVFGDVHKKIVLDKRLREIDLGDITGKPDKDLDKYRISGFPNGENYFQVRDRVISFLSEIIDKHPGQRVAIAAHSGIWKVLENIVHGVKFDQEHLKIHATREPVDYEISDLFFVGSEAPKSEGWEQDPDTLDTWFSSGSWTFSTLGWPEKTKDLEAFHPTNWMQMGYEILYLWLMRMVLMSTYALGEIPFRDAYIHGMLRNEQGKKFSKSDANGIDPLDIIEKYGCDALRLCVLSGNTPGNDSRFSIEKIESSRNFVNKVWNIARYILTTIGSPSLTAAVGEGRGGGTLADKWILGRLETVTNQTGKLIEQFDFSLAIEILREFIWNDFADWYLEIAKIQQKDETLRISTNQILLRVLEQSLILCHPFMPFVTETIWGQMGKESLLMVESWPSLKQKTDEKVTKDFSALQEIIVAIRNLRSENKVEPVKLVTVSFTTNEKEILTEQAEIIKTLARVSEISFVDSKPEDSVSCVIGQTSIYLSLAGLVDTEKEKDRLAKELENVEKYLLTLEKQLANQEFVAKAPAKVIEGLKQKQDETNKKSSGLKQQLKNL
ncbi:MAG: class I tRNA ligase family protein [Candidatus Uhrbacteria bacterium]